MCSNLSYKWGDVIDFYKNDIKKLNKEKKFITWLYSGTEDIQCTTLATLRTLNELNFTIKDKWKKWIIDDQVVGMEQTYDHGLTFLTVKNAGHLVVEDQPKIAKDLLDKFIQFNMREEDDTIYTDNWDNTSNDSLSTWAIVIISIGSFLVTLIVAAIIYKKCINKSPDIDIEEKGKFINPISDNNDNDEEED